MLTCLIDGGYFVGRFEKHWRDNPKRKNMKYWWEQGKAKKVSKKERDAHLHRLFGYDLGYLKMKLSELGSVGRVIVCYDGIYGRRPRGSLYSDYKRNRRGGIVATEHRGIDVRKRIRKIGHNPHRLMDGWDYDYDDYQEADDLIAELCVSLPDTEDIVVMTKDGDLIQLMVQNNVRLHDFNELISDEVVFNKHGVHPNQYLDFKALAGDKSDNIPGIKGIGPKTAAKYLSEYGCIDEFPVDLMSSEAIETAKLWKKISTLPFHHD